MISECKYITQMSFTVYNKNLDQVCTTNSLSYLIVHMSYPRMDIMHHREEVFSCQYNSFFAVVLF